jgi:serine/threonine protein kinase
MHAGGVVWLDLKPQNIMLKATGPSLFDMKAIDLDSARVAGEKLCKEDSGLMPSVTPMYASNEVVASASPERLRACYFMDVRSLGLVVAQMLHPECTPVFESDDRAWSVSVVELLKTRTWCDRSDSTHDLVAKMLTVAADHLTVAHLLATDDLLNPGAVSKKLRDRSAELRIAQLMHVTTTEEKRKLNEYFVKVDALVDVVLKVVPSSGAGDAAVEAEDAVVEATPNSPWALLACF